MHSGVCASAKVKRWHDKANLVPCKHNPASMQVCQAACVCMCVCALAHVRVRVRVCVSQEASSWCPLVGEGMVKVHASTQMVCLVCECVERGSFTSDNCPSAICSKRLRQPTSRLKNMCTMIMPAPDHSVHTSCSFNIHLQVATI